MPAHIYHLLPCEETMLRIRAHNLFKGRDGLLTPFNKKLTEDRRRFARITRNLRVKTMYPKRKNIMPKNVIYPSRLDPRAFTFRAKQ